MPDAAQTPPAVANTPFVLIIRDGWGRNPNPSHDPFNAVKIASQRGLTPVADALERDWPSTLIKTSGEDVGLPDGTMGNSEVGHQNIGAGRVVDQESVAITKACRPGAGGRGEPPALHSNDTVVGAIKRAKAAGRYVHLMGIASDAGVHGQLEHLYALLELCRKLEVSDVAVHLFTDGRDTGPFTGLEFVRQIESRCRRIGLVGEGSPIASVMGRYWAMDRDFRWERVERAYACLTGRDWSKHKIACVESAEYAVKRYYDRPPSPNLAGDEFVAPAMIGRHPDDAMRTRVADGDTVIFYNYRGDRPREIVSAFVLPNFDHNPPDDVKPSPDSGKRGFARGARLQLDFITMTSYAEFLAPHVKVAFPKPPKMSDVAGEWWSKHGLSQFRCAETEKYPHVTFFFNDYRDQPFPNERRENPQSPKVATYDLKPEMAAEEVCAAVLRRLEAPDAERILVVNFANGDMVGHTGNLEAAVKACAAVDSCVGRIVQAVLARRGSLIITADHGNAEQMFDPATNAPHTAHTTYDVPLHVVGEHFKGRRLRSGGRLADIVPTSLEMIGLPKPDAMTGRSLLE